MSVSEQVVRPILNGLEDSIRLLRLPWQLQRPIWYCRYLLSEGKVRRNLRKAAKAWHRSASVRSEHYFREYDVDTNLDGQKIVVTVEYRDDYP